jgi:hypothetical protein
MKNLDREGWMKTGLEMILGGGLLVLAPAPTACTQALGTTPAALTDPGAEMMLSPGGSALAQSRTQGEIVREIDDPHTGDRWLLVRNDRHPGGPGRLVLASVHGNESGGAHSRAAVQAGEASFHPVIRAGDRLIVEEHTARVDAVLEARALGPAAAGSAFDVRLKIGGKVVPAMALAPGRAAFQPETGVRP